MKLPVIVQGIGGLMVGVSLAILFGWPVAVLACGVLLVVLGTAAEAGWL